MDGETRALLRSAAERSARYLDQLDSRAVATSCQALERLALLDGALPDARSAPEEVLELLDSVGSPATVASASGRYFGFVIGGSLPVSVAANWLATAWDQNAGLVAASPVAAALESIALRWLLD